TRRHQRRTPHHPEPPTSNRHPTATPPSPRSAGSGASPPTTRRTRRHQKRTPHHPEPPTSNRHPTATPPSPRPAGSGRPPTTARRARLRTITGTGRVSGRTEGLGDQEPAQSVPNLSGPRQTRSTSTDTSSRCSLPSQKITPFNGDTSL